MTPGDVECGLGERTVVVVEKKPSSGWIWKMFMALLMVGVCIAGALVFTWYMNGRPETKTQSGQTEALTGKVIGDATEPHHTLRRIGSKAKAAIHLEGSYEDGEGFKDQVEWRKDQGQAFAQGGLRLVDNQITIPQTGLFFVYSQASFRVSCSDDDGEFVGRHVAPLSHRIWRFSDSVGGRSSLLSAVRSACQRVANDDGYRIGEGWYNAIYLGAVFQLNRGDRLWTETNQLTEIESEGGRTFFGVFAL
ncbi:tumor necrosis factor b (TNF superfamily, member 2) [Lampris incognitus]|uniref:tumor necrosis factor b (TNF superfamily, member 2) n=1 Tax=Lampris incognitus TaxID=2546036 RepID=UPI0024B4B13C|nr:tumor necrosis factor b (TNF superfamily, member 2) [Lampris incognitus]